MVCLTFPIAHPNIFCVPPKHATAAPPPLRDWQHIRQELCLLPSQPGHSRGHRGATHGRHPSASRLPCFEHPGSKASSSRRTPVPRVHLLGACSCPKSPWKQRGIQLRTLGVWRGSRLLPRPTFSLCKTQSQQRPGAAWCDGPSPLSSPRPRGSTRWVPFHHSCIPLPAAGETRAGFGAKRRQSCSTCWEHQQTPLTELGSPHVTPSRGVPFRQNI